MNKSQLVAAVAASTSDKVSDSVAAEAVDAAFSAIVRAVTKGDQVTVTGFGVFEKRRRAARVARNPRTGEKIRVKATSVVAFRPSSIFKDAVAKRTKLEKSGSVIKRGASAAPAPVKKVAAKKAPAKKSVPATKSAPAKKVVAKKTATVKKAVAKKAPTKRTSKK